MSRGSRIVGWLDERIGVRAIHRALFARKIPPGTGWIYTLGSIALFLFVVQAATGAFMAMSYAPTPDHAYDSVRYLTEEAPFGSVLRGLHVWGASAMVAALVLHMLRTFLTGAYKFPRELTWVSGVGLFLVVLGFGFTGYLLPWNQKAYWATEVGTRVAEQAPMLGPALAQVLRGGDEIGAQTLTRFYALHVLLLPALFLSLVGVHLFLVVRQGISAPPRRGEATARGSDPPEERARTLALYEREKESGRSFFPFTLAKDAAAALVVLSLLALLAWQFPPEVGEIADPTDVSFNPRPEWYFLWLFQLLKYFPGRLEWVAAVVGPSLAVLALLALPFLDRSRHRHPLDRRIPTVVALAVLGGVGALTFAGATSPLVSAYVPEPPAVAAGARAFRALDCNHCHSIRGEGGTFGPDLALGSSARGADWVADHLRDPSGVISGPSMPTMGALPDEIAPLLAFIEEARGGGPFSENASRLFRRQCSECHTLDGRGGDKGPDLSAIGSTRSRSFIHRYIEDPKSLLGDSRMPSFLAPEGPYSHEQIEDLARFLAARRGGSDGTPNGEDKP